MTPGSKSEYRLRSDVVARSIVPSEPAATDFDKLEETLYKMIAEEGYVRHLLVDGHICAQRVGEFGPAALTLRSLKSID